MQTTQTSAAITLTAEQVTAVIKFGRFTQGRYDLWALAGRNHAGIRAHIMTLLDGENRTQAQSGVTALRSRLIELSGVVGSCRADEDDAIAAWCNSVERDAPVA